MFQGEQKQLWGVSTWAPWDEVWKALIQIPFFHVGNYKVPFVSSSAILARKDIEVDAQSLAFWMAEYEKDVLGGSSWGKVGSIFMNEFVFLSGGTS